MGEIAMTTKELNRIKILSQVIDGKTSQVAAAKKLGISDRHVRRLLLNLKGKGDSSIISKKRGKVSNRCLSKELKTKALSFLQNHYVDFGPTLANEYLKKEHNIFVSTETLRLWMIEKHLWIAKSKRNKKLHPPRSRRHFFGELIQVDGSYHSWFEERGPPCVLMVFIDDATSIITSLHFALSESLETYYYTLKKHIDLYGIPLSIYGDRCAVLAPRNREENKNGTQFQCALKELNCELILALSPQAKGRVERANRTLQDRLVKELRVRGISTIEEANVILEDYRKRHNQLFSKKPSEQRDVHRLLEGICLENVLCIREIRTLSKDNIVQFKNNFYQISSQAFNHSLHKGAKIEIRQLLNGKMVALFKNKLVTITPLKEASLTLDEKQLLVWSPKKQYTPALTHPYKHKSYLNKIQETMMRKVI